ncbi:MAG TPA: 16S rRNA (cytosine(1402)-N(4))-methyltransferase RsmH [Chitinophagaceae bacterium]|nr:16S rRNA (cytosine(1402)-N(4))-methyltransferase RsmH [Chitinophagaceae bacterium]
METNTFYHQSVLLHECIENLNIKPNGIYLDATFGGGGHSNEILKHLGPKGKLIVFDQDIDAKQNLPDDNRVIFVQENFRYANRFARLYKLKLDGVLADLGVSSYQFDTAERGFSIRYDAQLDMRMDQRTSLTATHILNMYSEKRLHQLFEEYGEVSNAKTLAKKIADTRSRMKITTINEFKQAIDGLMYGNQNKYLAQVFQALRIEVNDEMNALREFLSTITNCLQNDGRLVIITFHSLEDRIVKQWMKLESFEEEVFSFKNSEKKKHLKLVNKKPILPSAEEQKLNPRSRSAKLRVAQKIEH